MYDFKSPLLATMSNSLVRVPRRAGLNVLYQRLQRP